MSTQGPPLGLPCLELVVLAWRCWCPQVELSSESNLFFLYAHDLDDKSFAAVQVRRAALRQRCSG